MTHAAAEIAVRRGNAAFARRHDAHMSTETRTAGRRAYSCTGFDECIDITGMDSVEIYLLTAWNDNAAYMRMNFMAF